MKMIKFPSIEQFNTTIKNLRMHLQYAGKNEDGKAIYDSSKVLPTIQFKGTIKLHGTNAGVSWDTENDVIWAQSRERILTIESDNAGFAFFVQSRAEILKDMIKRYFTSQEVEIPKGIITLFGEWAGPGIQKGVAISQIEKKAFFIFDMKVTQNAGTEEEIVTWYDHSQTYDMAHGTFTIFENVLKDIYDIETFEVMRLNLDLNQPEMYVNWLIGRTEEVEKQCPVGMYFGKDGIGEGIVWRARIGDDVVRFKVKGEKHSSSKVKQLVSVDMEKVANINEFVEYAVTENRLNQGIEQVFTQYSKEPSIEDTGAFVKWVSSDVIKEEMQVMQESGLEPKSVMGGVSKKAIQWYKNYLMKN